MSLAYLLFISVTYFQNTMEEVGASYVDGVF